MIVPLRLALCPAGPVTVAVDEQEPPPHVVEPLLVVTPPDGPTNCCWDEQRPPAHEPEPCELKVPPRGPVPPPFLDHPASDAVAPASITAAASERASEWVSA